MSWRHHNDYTKTHDDVINGNIFRVTGHLWWKSTGHRWIPLTKASDAELWFLFLICAWTNCWANNQDAGDLRHHYTHYDVTVTMTSLCLHSAVDIEEMPTGALGMESGRIPDSAIWAQNYDLARPAWTGRLRTDNKVVDRGFPTYFQSHGGQEETLFRVSNGNDVTWAGHGVSNQLNLEPRHWNSRIVGDL